MVSVTIQPDGPPGQFLEHFVVEDRDNPGRGRELMARIAGPFSSANEARAERDRLQGLYPQRYAGAYVVASQHEGGRDTGPP